MSRLPATEFRRYPRNSPQAAGRILAVALLANGDIKPEEWQRLGQTQAFDKLGLAGLAWHGVLDDLCQDLMARHADQLHGPQPSATRGKRRNARAPGDCLIDMRHFRQWLDEIDDEALRRQVLSLCVELVIADGEVQPGEALALRTAVAHWVLPLDVEAQIAPMLYGLDFQVLPRSHAGLAA